MRNHFKYNLHVALAKHMFWLANMLDPFAYGLHADTIFFTQMYFFLAIFIDVGTS